MLHHCLLLTIFGVVCIRSQSVTWTSIGDLPSTNIYDVQYGMPSGTMNNEVLYLFFKDDTSGNNKVYKKNFTVQSYPNWVEVVTSSPSYGLKCDWAKCSTTINGKYIYMMVNDEASGVADRDYDIYIFDTTNEQWTGTIHVTPTGYNPNMACFTSDGSDYLYIVGGTPSGNGDDNYNYFKIYGPLSNNPQWSTINNMPTPVYYPGCSYFDNKLYIFGGYNTNNNLKNTIQIYDFNMNMWQSSTPTLPQGLGHMRTIVANDDKIYIIGGIAGGNYINTVRGYDTITEFFSVSYLNSIRANSMVEIINNKIIVCGGRKGYTSSDFQYSCEQSNVLTLPPTEQPTMNPSQSPTAPTPPTAPTTLSPTAPTASFPTAPTSPSPISSAEGSAGGKYAEYSKDDVNEPLLFAATVFTTVGFVASIICLIFYRKIIQDDSSRGTFKQTLKAMSCTDKGFMILKIFDVGSDFAFSIDLLLESDNEIIKIFGWIAFLTMIIGVVLFGVKILLMRKVLYRITKIKKERNQYHTTNQQTEIKKKTKEIRDRNNLMLFVDLLAVSLEDCPQTTIALLILIGTGGESITALVNVAISLLTLFWCPVSIFLSYCGCNDDPLEEEDETNDGKDGEGGRTNTKENVQMIPLPHEWTKHYTNEGKVYYQNNMTQTTQWQHPATTQNNII